MGERGRSAWFAEKRLLIGADPIKNTDDPAKTHRLMKNNL
jgi:hypothetical protein